MDFIWISFLFLDSPFNEFSELRFFPLIYTCLVPSISFLSRRGVMISKVSCQLVSCRPLPCHQRLTGVGGLDARVSPHGKGGILCIVYDMSTWYHSLASMTPENECSLLFMNYDFRTPNFTHWIFKFSKRKGAVIPGYFMLLPLLGPLPCHQRLTGVGGLDACVSPHRRGGVFIYSQ